MAEFRLARLTRIDWIAAAAVGPGPCDANGSVVGADDASTLVKIFSAAISIFKYLFLYNRKKEFSSFLSVVVEDSLRFFSRFNFFQSNQLDNIIIMIFWYLNRT